MNTTPDDRRTAVAGPFDWPVRPRAMWVVEILEGTRWRPTEWVGLTRARARDQMRDWKADGASDRLRVVRYFPSAA